MNGEDAVESIADAFYKNPDTAAEQALSVGCVETLPQSSGIVICQKDDGLKRKHCESFSDTEVGEKKLCIQDEDRNVTTCEREVANYESAHESVRLSATLKASFFDESQLPRNKMAVSVANENQPEDGKKGRRRKKGQGRNRVSENFSEREIPLQQTNIDSGMLESNPQKTTIAQQQTENSVGKMEKSVPNIAAVGSEAFPKLIEKPKPNANKIISKPSLSKPNLQETSKPSENPRHKETQQLNNTKVVNNSFCLEIKSKQADSKSVPSLLKPKRFTEVFMYGNYSRYYGYRSPVLEEDVRLSCFSQSFFQGKEVLDIGCNIGHVTLLIARDWGPKRIVGLDIDGKLISIAKKNVKHYMGHKNVNGSRSKNSSQASSSNGNNFNSALQPDELFPNNVMFMQGNYVLARDDLVNLQKEEYDVILALSISKWIHLNFGDDGLRRTFQRVYHQLRPGGKFILEPQEWSSYKRKKKLTETIFENFKNIKFRPDNFRNYLLSGDVGFSSCELIGIPNNKSKGFRRPLLMFTKGSLQNRIESLCETDQQNNATDEHHSMSTSATDTITEKVAVESGSKDFSEVNSETEKGDATQNAAVILTTKSSGNEVRANAMVDNGEEYDNTLHVDDIANNAVTCDASLVCCTSATTGAVTYDASLVCCTPITTGAVTCDASLVCCTPITAGAVTCDASLVCCTPITTGAVTCDASLVCCTPITTGAVTCDASLVCCTPTTTGAVTCDTSSVCCTPTTTGAVTCDASLVCCSPITTGSVTCDTSLVCCTSITTGATHETSCVILLPNNASEVCSTSV